MSEFCSDNMICSLNCSATTALTALAALAGNGLATTTIRVAVHMQTT
jgi:hypothetical protein